MKSKVPNIDYDDNFRDEIWKQASLLFSKEPSEELKNLNKREMLKDMEVRIIDRTTGLLIEIPCRCKQCPTRENVMELRTMIYLAKECIKIANSNKTPTFFNCPLCGNKFT